MNEQTWQVAAINLAKLGKSWRKVSSLVGKPKSTVSDYLRKYFNGEIETPKETGINFSTVELVYDNTPAEPEIEHENTRILFISDMHIPYHHRGLLPFLEGLKRKYDPTRVVCVGDELDKHALSFHDSDPDLKSAGDELAESLPVIKTLEEMFPVVDLVDSNHGSLLYRRAKHHGIPRHYLKGYNEVLGVGEGWKWHMDLVLDMSPWDRPDVYVHHGKSSDAIKVSQTMGMSHVCGHYHESFGIKYWASPTGLYFAMNTGCLIDRKSLAFKYANNNLKKQIIGTGLIIEGEPILEAMPL